MPHRLFTVLRTARSLDVALRQAVNKAGADSARFVKLRETCLASDGSLYWLDEILLRRNDQGGQVATWAF